MPRVCYLRLGLFLEEGHTDQDTERAFAVINPLEGINRMRKYLSSSPRISWITSISSDQLFKNLAEISLLLVKREEGFFKKSFYVHSLHGWFFFPPLNKGLSDAEMIFQT